MRSMRTLPHCAFAGAVLSSMVLLCASVLPAQQIAAPIRIVDRIDESKLVALKGNTHPAANAKNDRGRVSPDLRMSDLILVLSRSPEQQAAFEKFVAGQYDPNSPDFHHWLTPQQVGQNFGPSENDVAAISSWLTGHGLSVDEVTPDRMSIRFSGTASQVESAFHTEIHNLQVRGASHIGNMSDPQIPAALAPALVGVKALHNFFPHPLHRLGSQVSRDSETGRWKRSSTPLAAAQSNGSASRAFVHGAATSAKARPQFGINVGGSNPYLVEDVAPYDFATIYNVLPLWNKGIDGTGQTIAIAGTSDIDPNDVATFRNFFGLPTSNAANTPIRISGNSSQLTVCTDTTGTVPFQDNPCEEGDLIENSLDVEWSASVAKNAQIVLVASYPASVTDDTLYDSESKIVNTANNPDDTSSPLYGAHIMNVSYGECEQFNGTAGNVQYYDLWQTAAAEGLAVFVASGDSGSASCDDGGDEGGNNLPYPAEYGLSVNGLGSTPYNTSVGGTDFNWCSLTSTGECTPAPYWSSTNNASTGESTALGYVPEVPWNDTCTSPLALGWMEENFVGSFSYPVTDAETGCNAILNYESALNNPDDYFVLYFVDTIGGSGGASGCVVSTSTSTTTGSCTTSATSTGATSNPDTGAAQASIALTNDGWQKPSWQTGVTGIPSDGVRDLPDVSFFASDGFLSSSAYLICVSAVSPCSYDSKTEPIAEEVGGTSVATPAMAGVMALINQKTGASQGSPNAELYKLAAQQTYSNCSAENVKASSTSCYFNDIDTGTNAMACDDGIFNGGVASPDCAVKHAADEGYFGILSGYSAGTGYDMATGLGSLNIANVVNAWPAASGSGAVTITVTPAPTSIAASQSLGVSGTVASSPSGGTTPTGSVTLTAGSYSASMQLSSTGTYSFTVPANSLSAGTDTLNVAYSGDTTYSSSSAQASVTVTATATSASYSITQTPIAVNPTSISPGATATATVTVSALNGYTGTVTLTCQLASTTATGGDGAQCTGGGEPGVALTASATTGTVKFTITTTAPTSAQPAARLAHPRGFGREWAGAGSGALLALLIFFGIPARRRSWRSMLGLLMGMVALGSMAACGGGGGSTTTTQSDPGTTAGVYTYTVVATGNPSAASAVQTTFTVTVN